MTRLTLRIDFQDGRALGPGKVRLLELVGETGSISAAARRMEMSYRRAWLLVDALNRTFRDPVVTTRGRGAGGGGAALPHDLVRPMTISPDGGGSAGHAHGRPGAGPGGPRLGRRTASAVMVAVA